MKQILKGLLIFALLLLFLPAGAWADELAKDDFAKVSCGGFHTLALRNNGDLWAWGANSEGQVGNGGESDSESISSEGGMPCQAQPVLVLAGVTDIAAGGWHSLAIRDDGSLWGWGMNAMGQLGQDSNKNIMEPLHLMDDVAAVAAGSGVSLILKTDGSLWAFGNNSVAHPYEDGQDNGNGPTLIMDKVITMAAGDMHALAVREDGSLWAWGLNQQGQAGIGKADDDHLYQPEPAQIFESGVTGVAAGDNHSLAIMEDGALWGWGDNSEGQLLEGGAEIIAAPQMLLTGATSASASWSRSFAIKEDNSLWGWGNNHAQAMNFNYKADYVSAAPKQIIDNVTEISSGSYHSMAVKADGTLWGWGDNSSGQLAQEPGPLGLPVRVKVEYPAWAEEPTDEPEPEPDTEPEPEPLPVEAERGSPLPFFIGCGVIGAGGVTGLIFWRKKRKGGVSAWRQ